MASEKIRIGEIQELKIVREREFGVYLGYSDDDSAVLLPKKEVPAGSALGDRLTVFVYRDSDDRPVSTLRTPLVTVGRFAILTVRSNTKIGSFLDIGIERDLFLPFREQEGAVRVGSSVPVFVYLDKAGRLTATMKLYDRLAAAEGFRKGDGFSGVVYRNSPDVGAMVAVFPKGRKGSGPFEKLYYGLLPKQTTFADFPVGTVVSGRVARVRSDGKLDLSVREKVRDQIGLDAEKVRAAILSYDGVLPFSESAPPEIIKRELSMSKSSFKKALGHLLKKREIEIGETTVTWIRKSSGASDRCE